MLSIADAGVELAFNNQLRLETNQDGVVVTGVTSATSFSGSAVGLTSVPSSSLTGALPSLDGSALTGITGSGSGVVVQHDGSNVGTAGTINFSTNLDVTPIHAGIVTVTASGITTETIRSDDIVTDGITVGVGTFTICGTNSFTANSVVVDGITTSTSFSGDGSGLTGVLKNVVEDTSPQLLEKYPDLAKLIGKSLYPYENSQSPDYERVPTMMRAGTDPFA